uniref:Uncharacterized protein n=1 Tax=Romanomermis culicivorax TaxID=13658 RepID=A0A915IET1_ROMCU
MIIRLHHPRSKILRNSWNYGSTLLVCCGMVSSLTIDLNDTGIQQTIVLQLGAYLSWAPPLLLWGQE